MDGYSVNKKFLCKELGFLTVGNAMAQSFFFDIGLRWGDLSPKDRRACKYVKTYIHKLPFGVPPGIYAQPLVSLENIMANLFKQVRKNNNSLIGYKREHLEKDLLASLGIPSVNMEKLGCPKAASLIKKMTWLETCGHHVVEEAYEHCPKVEVEAYGLWLEDQLGKEKQQ